MGLTLVAILTFLLIWNYLFAIDAVSVLMEGGGGGSAIEKTFTVRSVRCDRDTPYSSRT